MSRFVGIPDFQTLMRPVLVAIQGDEPKSTGQIRDTVATALNVSDEDRQVMLPSGKQALYTNRVAWAITHMTQAGLLNRPERGRYLLSQRGKKVLQEHPDRVDLHVLQQFPEYLDFRSRKSEKHAEKSVAVVSDELSPSEAVGALGGLVRHAGGGVARPHLGAAARLLRDLVVEASDTRRPSAWRRCARPESGARWGGIPRRP